MPKKAKQLKKWSRKKDELIASKNSEKKELVTEKGFVREKTAFSEKVENY